MKAVEIDQHGHKTTGKVIDVLETSEWQLGKLGYQPVIQFLDESGRLLERKLEMATTASWFWEKEQTVSITYYQGKVYLTSFGWMLLYMIFVLIGVGMVSYNLIIRYF
ncbi:hypothetical protein [Spirosoma fluminis]